MLQTINCIRMGEVLCDENQELFILCNNCHTDFRTLQDFRQHLGKCEGLENFFHQGPQQLKYNTDKSTQLFGKTLKGIKEFLIYDYNDVEVTYAKTEENFIDLINIEEELLDPKWYSDLNVDVTNSSAQKSSKQYDELVEAVTPFVQFKENVKSNNNVSRKSNLVRTNSNLKGNTMEAEKAIKNVKFEFSPMKDRPAIKRKLAMPKTGPMHLEIRTAPAVINAVTSNNSSNQILVSQISQTGDNKKPKVSNGFVHPTDLNTITTTMKKCDMLPPSTPTNIALNSLSQRTTIVPSSIIKHEPTKEKQTAQILSKLQNLGLQVKRTLPLPQLAAAKHTALAKTDTKTLEILQKLQLKGMKVKILNKQNSTETKVDTSAAKQLQGIVLNPAQKPINVVRSSAANMTIRQNLNKNLVIKRVN